MTLRVAIVDAPIDSGALLREVTSPSTGASTLFVGTVRDVNEDRSVSGIDYAAYNAMAHDELLRIVHEAAGRWPGIRAAVEHRTGYLVLQDASVAIAVAHARRAPAMDASRFIIEELKRRVPIWKREHYTDGDRQWIDPTASATAGART